MKLLGLLVTLAISTSLSAYDMKGKWGLGFDYGAGIPGGTSIIEDSFDESWSGTARVRFHASEKTAWQIEYDHFEFDDKVTGQGSSFGQESISLNYLLGIYKTNSRWYNYVSLGAGASQVKNSGFTAEEDYWRTSFKAGLGVEYFITRYMNLGFGLDYHYTQRVGEGKNFSEIHLINPSVSFTFYFGAVGREDQDKDGISDRSDKCADSPIGAYVDENGCADSQRDSDNDGVSDRDDKCSSTPQTDKVDANGCSTAQKDSDNDGISDRLDKCPNTEAGAKVNSAGCMEKEAVEITLNINFPASKATIDSQYSKELEKVALFLKTYPDTVAEIEGHSDSNGNRDWNVKLSQMRADAVKKYLVEEHGVSANRLTAKGYGPDKPIATNDTAAGRRANRRVVATFRSKSK